MHQTKKGSRRLGNWVEHVHQMWQWGPDVEAHMSKNLDLLFEKRGKLVEIFGQRDLNNWGTHADKLGHESRKIGARRKYLNAAHKSSIL